MLLADANADAELSVLCFQNYMTKNIVAKVHHIPNIQLRVLIPCERRVNLVLQPGFGVWWPQLVGLVHRCKFSSRWCRRQ